VLKISRNRRAGWCVLEFDGLQISGSINMSSYPTALQNENLIPRADEDIAHGGVRVTRSDSQLVELVLAGDETAFEQIFDRHKRMVGLVASRYFRRPEQIEDIIQISFAKAFMELSGFRGGHDLSLAGWVARITVNACFDALRSNKRRSEQLSCDMSESELRSLEDIASAVTADAEEIVLQRDLTEKLLARLPVEDRGLLQMLYAEEMSVAEIAELTGWSQSKVKIKAWRARNALRRTLSKFL
jgi:RNA polymerase sigma-70 factor (ECF subfamily)